MPTRKVFPIRSVVKIVGVEREAFKAWVHGGFIQPSVYQSKGPGEGSLYDTFDCYAIKLFQYLVNAGFLRKDASFKIKSFLKFIRENGIEDSETVYIAFLTRPVGKDKMIRKSGAGITDKGRIISRKALAPGVRILMPADLDRSFRDLFIDFSNTTIPEEFDLSEVALDRVTVINFTSLKRQVDSNIKLLSD
jgi:hypothetical protein